MDCGHHPGGSGHGGGVIGLIVRKCTLENGNGDELARCLQKAFQRPRSKLYQLAIGRVSSSMERGEKKGMGSKIVWAINIVLALIIVATLVWAFPFFVSAFYLSRGSQALEAALAEPGSLTPEPLARSVHYLQQAVRWDKNNAEAKELLAKAYSQLAVADIMQVASRWRMTDQDPHWHPRFDVDEDGNIDIVDIMRVAADWAETCE